MSLTRDNQHRYRLDGVAVPGVTEILSATLFRDEFAHVDPAVLDAARALGTAVHAATLAYDEDTLTIPLEVPPWAPYLDAWRDFCEVWGWVSTALETFVYEPVARYAGQVDRYGVPTKHPTRPRVVLDIKTGWAGAAKYQTAAYARALRAMGSPVEERWIVQLDSRGTFRLMTYDLTDYDDERVFLRCLAEYRSRPMPKSDLPFDPPAPMTADEFVADLTPFAPPPAEVIPWSTSDAGRAEMDAVINAIGTGPSEAERVASAESLAAAMRAKGYEAHSDQIGNVHLGPAPPLEDEPPAQIVIPLADQQPLAQESVTLAATAQTLMVVDQPSYDRAIAYADTLKQFQKRVVAFFAPMKKAAHEAHALICAREREVLGEVDTALAALTPRAAWWFDQADRERRLALRAAEAKARQEQEDHARMHADELVALGDVQAAAAVLREAEITPPVVPEAALPAAPTRAGKESGRTSWVPMQLQTPEQLDALYAFLAKPENRAHRILCPLNDTAYRRYATQHKGQLEHLIPGLKAVILKGLMLRS